ncbi:hypothetical protein BST30_15545 [Mycobacterium mantenii]|uniref:Uncharacterized protein n=1 Tax=Mycobacterium mantenii TaxID=560555 RepID=A0A1X0FSY0_MYCNT|nr:hypothetical protein BST30_15545 [Mycobacterium mantenii]
MSFDDGVHGNRPTFITFVKMKFLWLADSRARLHSSPVRRAAEAPAMRCEWPEGSDIIGIDICRQVDHVN